MSSLNKVILIGRVGRDPEVRNLNSGEAITNLSLATSEKWKDKASGEQQEKTEWHRVVFFGRTAEIAGQYAKKGSLICVEGSLATRKWTDKDGVEKYTTEIQGRDLRLLSSPPQGQGGGNPGAGRAPAANSPAPQRQQAARGRQDGFDDSDIPF